MLKEIEGREVVVTMGSASMVTDCTKGRVVSVDESWVKIQGKRKVEYINIRMIGSISLDCDS